MTAMGDMPVVLMYVLYVCVMVSRKIKGKKWAIKVLQPTFN